jgi:hypothetical protein
MRLAQDPLSNPSAEGSEAALRISPAPIGAGPGWLVSRGSTQISRALGNHPG